MKARSTRGGGGTPRGRARLGMPRCVGAAVCAARACAVRAGLAHWLQWPVLVDWGDSWDSWDHQRHVHQPARITQARNSVLSMAFLVGLCLGVIVSERAYVYRSRRQQPATRSLLPHPTALHTGGADAGSLGSQHMGGGQLPAWLRPATPCRRGASSARALQAMAAPDQPLPTMHLHLLIPPSVSFHHLHS